MMGICLSSKDNSVKTFGRSNKVKDCSSISTKENQQSGSGERFVLIANIHWTFYFY